MPQYWKVFKNWKSFQSFIEGKKSGMNFYLYLEIYPIKEDEKLTGFVHLGEKILGKEKLDKFSRAEEFEDILSI